MQYPYRRDRPTSGANNKKPLLPRWGPEEGEYTLKEIYDQIENDPDRPFEPQVYFNCKEAVTRWIEKQEAIIGAVYNLRDEAILQLLEQKKYVKITINEDEALKENKQVKTYYPKIKFSDSLGDWDGISVFGYKDPGDNNYQRLMHHKFLIGYEKWGTNRGDPKSRSLLYGSFNMSWTSPAQIDSVLIFNETFEVMDTFEYMSEVLHWSSIPWSKYVSSGFDLELAEHQHMQVFEQMERAHKGPNQ